MQWRMYSIISFTTAAHAALYISECDDNTSGESQDANLRKAQWKTRKSRRSLASAAATRKKNVPAACLQSSENPDSGCETLSMKLQALHHHLSVPLPESEQFRKLDAGSACIRPA